jgi:hypothetical protein
MPFVKPVTGPGITSAVAMELADLGIARFDPQRNALALMFGDNFSFSWGQDWQSPSLVMYDADLNVLGVPTPSGIALQPRRQLWPYGHNNPDYSTVLPCDFIWLRGTWYVAVMLTQGLGNERVTEFWQSRDLCAWYRTDPFLQLRHPGHPGNVMLTFDQFGDYVHICGTNGLARDRPIWLWRCPAGAFPYGRWEPYGWDGSRWAWGHPNEDTPIIGGRAGELCLRNVQGNAVLSYFDAERYCQTAVTAATPDDLADPARCNRIDYAFGQDTPQLYGGYIVPGSELNRDGGMRFLVSQWGTAGNNPYHVLLFDGTLEARGGLSVTYKPPEPAPELLGTNKPPEPASPQPEVTPVAATPRAGWTGDPIWLEDVLRPALGDRLRTLDGWQDRGHGDFQDIRGVMVHHTGNSREPAESIARGRPDLDGPLANLHIAPDGTVTIVAVGVCWHAGRGAYPWLPTNDANWHMIGIECAWPDITADGTYNPRQRWPDAQIISMRDTCAALTARLGLPASHVIGHKEWAGAAQGKWDPGNLDMNWFRGEVTKAMAGEFRRPAAEAEVPPPILPAPANGRTDRQLLEDVWASLRGPGGRGWPQLGDLTVVDSLALLHRKLDAIAERIIPEQRGGQ